MDAACAHAQELIQRGLDHGLLNSAEESLLDDHLHVCAKCMGFAREMALMTQIVERLPRCATPDGLVSRVMVHIPARQSPQAGWARFGQAWAPLAGLAGVVLLIHEALAAKGLSLMDLPAAFGEWAGLVDLSRLESLGQATSLFCASIGVELLVAFSLIAVAVFGLMLQVIARPPAIGMTMQRQS
jgi:hypothetical protein